MCGTSTANGTSYFSYVSNEVNLHAILVAICRFPSVALYDATRGGSGVNPESIESAFAEHFRLVDVEDVNFDAFMQFHHDVSATINSDRIFEAFVRNTWHLA